MNGFLKLIFCDTMVDFVKYGNTEERKMILQNWHNRMLEDYGGKVHYEIIIIPITD